MTATEAPTADTKTDTKTDSKSKNKSKNKTSKPKTTAPSEEAIKSAMATLEAAGMMDAEEQMEEVVAFKLRAVYTKIVDIIGKLTDDEGNPESPTEEHPGIVIFPDGEFGYVEDENEDDDEDEDISTSKGKGSDWRAEAARLQKALIAFHASEEMPAQDIRDRIGGKKGKNPALTTVYNWLNGKSLPNRKYHRKLRSLLGL
jgi:hypothetical protein